MDEEIDSDLADDDEDMNDINNKRGGDALKNDPFFHNQDAQEDQTETVEEKRLKMTKQLLQELE